MGIALFAGKRLAVGAVLILVVSFLVFSLQSLAGTDPIALILGGRPAAPGQLEEIRAQYHLDDPFFSRYLDWLGSAIHGDFGTSIGGSEESVSSLISQRLPVTFELVAITMVLIIVIGVPLGMIAGIRHGSRTDRTISTVTLVGLSAPVFATGIVLLYVFGVFVGGLPVYGAGGPGLADRLDHLLLPAVALAVTMIAIVARQTRASTLTVMQQDYVTFARSRGVPMHRILFRYALRNTAMPVITITGLLLIYLVGGTILVEQVFALEGLGKLMVASVQSSNLPVVQGITLVFAAVVVVVNLVVDIVGMIVDPRTRYATKG